MCPTCPTVGLSAVSPAMNAVAALAPAEPMEPQPLAVVVEQLLDADLSHRQIRACGPPALEQREEVGGARRVRRACRGRRAPRTSARAPTGAAGEGRWPARAPAARTPARRACRRAHRTRPAGAAARTRRAPRFNPLMRPCGIAMPWPRPVEPSFSRAAGSTRSRSRSRPPCAANGAPTASNSRAFVVASRSSRMLLGREQFGDLVHRVPRRDVVASARARGCSAAGVRRRPRRRARAELRRAVLAE